MKRYVLFAIIAVVLSYSPEWVPHYIALFSKNLIVIGSLDDFRQPCQAPSQGQGVCYHEYFLPPDALLRAGSGGSVGLGSILVATEIFCDKNRIATFDDPSNPGRSYDSYNRYVTVSIQPTCSGGMTIRAWGQPNSTRHGLVGGRLVIGSDVLVSSVARSTEFFSKEIRILILLLFIFSFLVHLMSSTISSGQAESHPFERYGAAWIGFLAVSSGFMQLFLPIYERDFYTRVSAFFSFCAHLGPLLLSVFLCCSKAVRASQVRQKLLRLLVWSGAIAVSLHPGIRGFFAMIFLLPAIAGCAIGLVRSDYNLSIYSFILIASCLKLLNVPFTPVSHITSIYVAMVLVDLSLRRLSLSRHLLNSINIGRKLVTDSETEQGLKNGLLDLSRHLRVGRLTLIELGESNECNISILITNGFSIRFETFSRASIPTLAAHVITTKSPIWHMNNNSEKFRRIVKHGRQLEAFSSNTFSVLPVSDSSNINAVLAFTNYGDDEKTIRRFQENRATAIEILQPYLNETSKKRKVNRMLYHTQKLTDVTSQLGDLREKIQANSLQPLEDVISRALEIVLKTIGSSGFIAEVHPATHKLNILGIKGYSERLTDQYQTGTIIADPKNMHGPIPLAYSRNEIIIVSDVSKIESVLHPVSLKIIRENDTESFAAIPIQIEQQTYSDVGESKQIAPWGIIWIEQKRGNELTHAHRRLLETVQAEINCILRILKSGERLEGAKQVIYEMMPRWAAQMMILGEKPTDRDHGYLVVIDLKASSKIAQKFGAEVWGDFIKTAVEPLFSKIAIRFGFKVHLTIWDAFYLCAPSEQRSEQIFLDALNMIVEITDATTELYRRAGFTTIFGDQKIKFYARSVIAFGDTTRGLTSSPNPTWSIIGTTIAVASKLEQSVKGAEGDIFTLPSEIPDSIVNSWFQTDRWVEVASTAAMGIRLEDVENLLRGLSQSEQNSNEVPYAS
jgi:hypothetical protein